MYNVLWSQFLLSVYVHTILTLIVRSNKLPPSPLAQEVRSAIAD